MARVLAARRGRARWSAPAPPSPLPPRRAVHLAGASGARYTVGEAMHGFVVREASHVLERDATTVELVHERTGARHVHVDCADRHNTFMACIKGAPESDKGVAHVLEHLVLCGSARFPVSHALYAMRGRSLQSYMNAFTDANKTAFAFTTAHASDFANLLSVYLDALFYPALHEADFEREAHALAFSRDDSYASQLVRTGVVLSEMKAVMGNPSAFLYTRISAALFPTSPYRFNSGGDPEAIPHLTYQELVEFHHMRYAPCNLYTLTYGNFSLEDHLRTLNEALVASEAPMGAIATIPDETRFLEPQRVRTRGPAFAGAGLYTAVVAFLLPRNTDGALVTALYVLCDYLLTGPLQREFMRSGLGGSLAPSCGLDLTSKEMTFTVGLQGISAKDAEHVEDVVMNALRVCVRDGIKAADIYAITQRIELQTRTVTAAHGVELLASLALTWLHGASPADSLRHLAHLSRVRDDVSTSDYLERLLYTHFIDNTHRVCLILEPDPLFFEDVARKERQSLDELARHMNSEMRREILERQRHRDARQQRPQDLSVLPSLTLTDVVDAPPSLRFWSETCTSHISGVPVTWFPQPTHGIAHIALAFCVDHLPLTLLPYVPLFSLLLSSTVDVMQVPATNSVQPLVHADVEASNYDGRSVVLRIAALSSDLAIVMQCWVRAFALMVSVHEPERLKHLVRQEYARLRHTLLQAGETLTAMQAASALSSGHAVRELWNGVSQVRFLAALLQRDDFATVAHRVGDVAQRVLAQTCLRVAVHVNETDIETVALPLRQLLARLPRASYGSPVPLSSHRQVLVEAHTNAPSAARVYLGVPPSHELAPALTLVAHLVAPLVLRETRMSGAAYTGTAHYTHGALCLYTRGDTAVDRSLLTFEHALRLIADGRFAEQALVESKLYALALCDQPAAPGEAGLRTWLRRESETIAYAARSRLLAVDRVAVAEAAAFAQCQPIGTALLGGPTVTAALSVDPAWSLVRF